MKRIHHSVDNVTARAGVVEMEKINHSYRRLCSESIVVILSV